MDADASPSEPLRTHAEGLPFTTEIPVEFCDCDDAGIVFYANYFRWFDTGFHRLLRTHGLDQRSIRERWGVLGTPIFETQSRFKQTITYGETFTLEVRIAEWRDKTVHIAYRGLKDGRLAHEGTEVRGLVGMQDGRLRALPIARLKAVLSEPIPETPA
ncbi:MAG: acyl-CoA thioesterase [Pseudomonadota bacterium]